MVDTLTKPEIKPQVEAFLGETMPAFIGTKRADGTVQIATLWFKYQDGVIELNGGPDRRWAEHVRRDGGRVSLYFSDPTNMWRWARVEGTLIDEREDIGREHINERSRKDLGQDYGAPGERIVFRVRPERVTSSYDSQW